MVGLGFLVIALGFYCATGWDLQVSSVLTEIPVPTDPELTALRRLLATMPASGAPDGGPPATPASAASAPSTEGAAP